MDFPTQVRLCTIVGIMHTSWEIMTTNDEDIKRVWAHRKNIRDSTNFDFLFDFCTLRLYLLAYVGLVYPVFVEKKIMLMTPWMVISGLRCLQPYLKYRIIFWLMVFRYWLNLVDDEIASSQMKNLSDNKNKVVSHLEQDETILAELRRKIKGVPTSVDSKRRSSRDVRESRDAIESRERRETKRDASNVRTSEITEDRNDGRAGPSEANDDDSLSDEEISSDEDSSESDEVLYSTYIPVRRYSIKYAKKPIVITDCIHKQIIALILILANTPEEELLEQSKKMMYERKRSTYKFEFMMPQDTDVDRINRAPYRKPQYMLDYPGIFEKTYNELNDQDNTSNRFQRMLRARSKEPGFDELRDTLEDFHNNMKY